ncbi:MAG: DNA-packaging protein [Gammaproteobacteria bacterium]|nr:DNA-packaging protein [Gammaproteobacteria bacterium]
MREIRFRCWDKREKEYRSNVFFVMEKTIKSETNSFIFEQFTSLKDQDGEDIYEGDILFDEHTEEFAVVVFEEGKFIARFEGVVIDLFEVCDTLGIRGNIQENPELLGE